MITRSTTLSRAKYKTILCALVVLILPFGAATAVSSGAATSVLGALSPARDAHEGTVLATDATNAKITIRELPSGIEMTFEVAMSALVQRDGKPAKLSDVRTGDSVMVITQTDGRKMVAMMVDAKQPV